MELLPRALLNAHGSCSAGSAGHGTRTARRASRVHREAKIWGWGKERMFSPSWPVVLGLSESTLRAMAPGAAQHFCRGDERSLDFTFPGSDRLQNHGPELLFVVIVASPDKSMSAPVNSILHGTQNLTITVKVKLGADVGCAIPPAPRLSSSWARSSIHPAPT